MLTTLIVLTYLKEEYIKMCIAGSNYRLEGGKLYVKKTDRYCD